jgi:two-component system cell cycle sensor histidine kinase/response regulator CckA
MPDRTSRRSKFIASAALGLFCALLGAALLDSTRPRSSALTRASYDSYFAWLGLNLPPPTNSPVVVVYLDIESHLSQHQDPNHPWPRELYAQMIRRLKALGARVVVFDVVFDSVGTNVAANAALRDAIADHGRVILAGELRAESSDGGRAEWGRTTKIVIPIEEFRRAAAGWGLGEVAADDDFVVRRYYTGVTDPSEPISNLTLAAAKAYGLDATALMKPPSRWLQYYGRPFSIPHRGFSQVLNPGEMDESELRDKIVFVGARPIAGLFKERRDEFRSPFSFWDEKDLFMPGVEVHATEMLNLVRGDWLKLPDPRTLELWIGLAGLALGAGLVWLRPIPASSVAAAGIGLTIATAVVLFRQSNVWFPWLIVTAVQAPLALGGSVLFNSIEWYLTRRRLEAAKRVADARIREQAALIEKAHDAILVRDLDGKISYANPSAERLFGWTAGELQNGAVNELFTDAAATEARQLAMERGEWNGELRQRAKSGAGLMLESRWTLLRDDLGNAKGLLIISSDVTEKKQLEAEWLRMQRMEAVGALAGGMAHDLNNALAPILMGTQLLRRDSKDENTKRVLSLMESSTRRGADMVRQVLLFARGKQGEFERLEVRPLVKEVEKLARDTFPQSIKVSAHVADDLWPVRGNATQLHQVLLNLCVNARDAMPDGGSLSLAADNVTLDEASARAIPDGRAGEFVVLLVSDTGSGMPPEVLAKVFEPFFTTKPEGKGTGLGLSTSVRIVKAHEGFLSVQSVAGEGTTFEVYLPRLLATSAGEGVEVEAPVPRGNGELILVADDDEAVLELLRRSLEEYGYRVVTATNGAEAVSLCKESREPVALVVSDQTMPLMEGSRALAAIQATRPELSAVLLCDEAAVTKQPGELSLTQVEYLPKPIELHRLLETVSRSLKQR